MDSMSFILITDRKLEYGLRMQGIQYSALSLSAPNSISSDLAMPKQVIATITNYLRRSQDPQYSDPDRRKRMQEVFGS